MESAHQRFSRDLWIKLDKYLAPGVAITKLEMALKHSGKEDGLEVSGANGGRACRYRPPLAGDCTA